MVLTMQEEVLVFHGKVFNLSAASQCIQMIKLLIYIYIYLHIYIYTVTNISIVDN